MDTQSFPSEAYDNWKTTPPPEREDLGRPLQPSDPCTCGHAYGEHWGSGKPCWSCPELDQVCDGFELDADQLEDDARADAENYLISQDKEKDL